MDTPINFLEKGGKHTTRPREMQVQYPNHSKLKLRQKKHTHIPGGPCTATFASSSEKIQGQTAPPGTGASHGAPILLCITSRVFHYFHLVSHFVHFGYHFCLKCTHLWLLWGIQRRLQYGLSRYARRSVESTPRTALAY